MVSLQKEKKLEVINMECKVNTDFYFSFIPIYNDENKFSDFILIEVSDNFEEIFNLNDIDNNPIVGKRISDIIFYFNDFFPSFKEVYYKLLPESNKKYKKYIYELNNYYLINMFATADLKTYLYFSDISFIN